MKIKKIVSQNIIIFPKINKIKDLPNSSLKYVHLCTQYLLAPLAQMTASVSQKFNFFTI